MDDKIMQLGDEFLVEEVLNLRKEVEKLKKKIAVFENIHNVDLLKQLEHYKKTRSWDGKKFI
jgi:hypothetical protein